MDSFADVGALPTWEQVLTSLIKPPDWQLRDGHEPPQPKAAKPDLWDPATSFEPTQGCQKYGSFWGC